VNNKEKITPSSTKLALNSTNEISATNGNISKEYCSIDALPISSTDELYTDLKESK
jgi:hypothetical protein